MMCPEWSPSVPQLMVADPQSSGDEFSITGRRGADWAESPPTTGKNMAQFALIQMHDRDIDVGAVGIVKC